jgi:DNA-binding beta-propeller fold protein YncE
MSRFGVLSLALFLFGCEMDATLLVTSSATNSILEYDSTTGAFLNAFVPSLSGGLSDPRGIAIGPAGDLFVSSFGTNSVLRYSGSNGSFMGAFVTSGSGGLSGPIELSFGPNGNLFVASSTSDQVLQYDGLSGAFINSFATGAVPALNTPRGMAFGNGHLFVSGEGDRLWRFDALSGVFQSSTLGDNPRGVTLGPDGNLYVAFRVSNIVARYDGNTLASLGTFVNNPGNGGLSAPMGLAFGPDSNLYVAGSGNDAILRYDGATGTFVDAFVSSGSGTLSSPQFFAFTTTVPEPGSVFLAIAGTVLLSLFARVNAKGRRTAKRQTDWSPDGKWIYYSSHRTGHNQIWKVGLSGKSAKTKSEANLPG